MWTKGKSLTKGMKCFTKVFSFPLYILLDVYLEMFFDSGDTFIVQKAEGLGHFL